MNHAKFKILILQAESETTRLLPGDWTKERFLLDTKRATTNPGFAALLVEFTPDLVLAVHNPAYCDGLAALALVRQRAGAVPFIFVHDARDEEAGIVALELGATDCVPRGKPESLKFAINRSLREIEERKRQKLACAALRETEERYRALFDRALDCLYVHDFEGRFLDANPAALALLGYERHEIPTVTFNNLLTPDQLEVAQQCMEEVALLGAQREAREFRLKHKNGTIVDVETTASLIVHEGKPFGVLGIARDVTQRKRAEAELRRVNRLYSVLSAVNQTIIRARTPLELIQEVCSITAKNGGFRWVRISRLDRQNQLVVPEASAGGPDEYINTVPIYADDRPQGRGPTGTAIRERRVCVSNDFLADPNGAPWQPQADLAGVKAVASFPIRCGEEIYGAFTLYDVERNIFQEKEIALLSGVADAISSGLDRLEQEAARKRAEDLLREKEEAARKSDARYRMIVKETGQVVYDYELATGLIQWEGAIEEVLGFNWTEMQQIDVDRMEERIHPEDRERALALLDNAIHLGRHYRVDYRFQRRDGSYIQVEERGSFLLDEKGQALRMLGTLSDITERKNSEARIREQARLLDMAHEAILARDLDDNIVYWNESAERLYGWTASEAVGQNVDRLLQLDPSKAAESKRAVLAQDEWNGEVTQTTKAGQAILAETRLTLVRDPQGQPKSILAINTDITARKRLEAQLLRSQRMESIGTLASGIAHDLNNVLSPIMMSCQLLGAYASEYDRRQLLDIISRSAQRGADLVKQVLSFCRGVEGRRMELQVSSLIGEVTQIARQTFPKSIHLKAKTGRDLWAVVADPTQLHQVVLNLCVNARDAMPNGGTLTVTTENVLLDAPRPNSTREGAPRPHVMITVSDTGTGIPPEIREKIFDPFFTTKEVGKGTGLGLSTSLGIVKSHGGFINVYSEPGRGSVFKVYLPALSRLKAESFHAAESSLPHGHGELILLVDDEAAVRSITKQTLQAYGYSVITASDGAEAIELHHRHSANVKVILMDMMMPVMDGPSTIHALSRRHPDLKVIAASGLSSENHMAQAPSDAVKAFLAKPYTAETLLKTVRQVLDGKTVEATKLDESTESVTSR